MKGIPISAVEKINPADLDLLIKSPYKYFGRLIEGRRKFITYEEFLWLNRGIRGEFSAIYILNNNLYSEQFPLEPNFSPATKNKLLEYFSENVSDTGEIPAEVDINDFAIIFNGVKAYKDILICAYNENEIPNDSKIETLNLFDAPTNLDLPEIDAENFIEIQDESDFIWVVQKIIAQSPKNIFLRISNYLGDKDNLKRRIKMLQEFFSPQTKIYCARPAKFEQTFEHRAEYNELLKRHWNVNNFRDFTVYDLQALSRGVKSTKKVSQEQIIANIVKQVESCEIGDNSKTFSSPLRLALVNRSFSNCPQYILPKSTG